MTQTPRRTCLAISALLIFAVPQIAAPQASQPCCQVNPPATAKPIQPASPVRGADKAPVTVLVFSDFGRKPGQPDLRHFSSQRLI
jgi:hypothetical protein